MDEMKVRELQQNWQDAWNAHTEAEDNLERAWHTFSNARKEQGVARGRECGVWIGQIRKFNAIPMRVEDIEYDPDYDAYYVTFYIYGRYKLDDVLARSIPVENKP